MGKVRNNQSGFSVIEASVILAIVGILGFTGWYVWHAQTASKHAKSVSQTKATTTNSQASKTPSLSATTCTDNGSDEFNSGVITYGGTQYPCTPRRVQYALQRMQDLRAIQSKLLVFYYNLNEHYPSLADINSATWWDAQSEGTRSAFTEFLVDPANPSKSSQFVATPKPDWYAYTVTTSDGQSCEANDTTCAKYTLTAIFEGTYKGMQQFVLSSPSKTR